MIVSGGGAELSLVEPIRKIKKKKLVGNSTCHHLYIASPLFYGIALLI